MGSRFIWSSLSDNSSSPALEPRAFVKAPDRNQTARSLKERFWNGPKVYGNKALVASKASLVQDLCGHI
jgi:hypothetical protein